MREMGSINSGNTIPNKDKTKIATKSTYLKRWIKSCGRLIWERIPEKRNRSKKSIIAPRGQMNPQKNLPRNSVATINTSVNSAMGMITVRDASMVTRPESGFKRRKNSLSNEYALGFLLIKKNKPRKKNKKEI